VLGYRFSLHLITSSYSNNINSRANLHVMGCYRLRWVCHLFVTRTPRRGGRKRLSLIQMILLRHLKAGFEKRANRRLRMGLLPHMRIRGCKLLLSSRGKMSNNAGEVVVAGWLAQLKRRGAIADSAIYKTDQAVHLSARSCAVSLRHTAL